jgi:hypothetical protein
MKKVTEGTFDMFVFTATLTMSSWFASTKATVTIAPARTWYGRLRGPALPINGGVLRKEIVLMDLVQAGGLEKYVTELVRKSLNAPQAVRRKAAIEVPAAT